MCPLRVNINRWVGSPQTLTVLSSDAVSNMRPFEAKLTLRTVPECAEIVVDFPSLERKGTLQPHAVEMSWTVDHMKLIITVC
jgi:hypothetical protein